MTEKLPSVVYQVRKGNNTLFENAKAKKCWTWAVRQHNDPQSGLTFVDLKVFAKIGKERIELNIWPTDKQKASIQRAIGRAYSSLGA